MTDVTEGLSSSSHIAYTPYPSFPTYNPDESLMDADTHFVKYAEQLQKLRNFTRINNANTFLATWANPEQLFPSHLNVLFIHK